MGDWGAIVVLLAAGALLELAGLFIVSQEVRSELESIQAFFRRDVTVYPDSIAITMGVESPTVTTGDEPTVEERVSLVEQRVERLEGEVSDAIKELRDQLHEDIASSENRIQSGLNGYHKALEKVITNVNPKLRYLGLGLFFFGLSLQTAASVWSMVRSG